MTNNAKFMFYSILLLGGLYSFDAESMVNCRSAKDEATFDHAELCGNNILIQKLEGNKASEFNNVDFYRIFGKNETAMSFNNRRLEEKIQSEIIFFPSDNRNFDIQNSICEYLLGPNHKFANTASYTAMTFSYPRDTLYKRYSWEQFKARGSAANDDSALENNKILKSINCRSFTDGEIEKTILAETQTEHKKIYQPSKPKESIQQTTKKKSEEIQSNEPVKEKNKIKIDEIRNVSKNILPITVPTVKKVLFYFDLDQSQFYSSCLGMSCPEYILESFKGVLYSMTEKQAVNVIFGLDGYGSDREDYFSIGISKDPLQINDVNRSRIVDATNQALKWVQSRNRPYLESIAKEFERQYLKVKKEYDETWFYGKDELKIKMDAKKKKLDELRKKIAQLPKGDADEDMQKISEHCEIGQSIEGDTMFGSSWVRIPRVVDLQKYDQIYVFTDVYDLGLSKNLESDLFKTEVNLTAAKFKGLPMFFIRYGYLKNARRGSGYGSSEKVEAVQMDEYSRFLKLSPSFTRLSDIPEIGNVKSTIQTMNKKIREFEEMNRSVD